MQKKTIKITCTLKHADNNTSKRRRDSVDICPDMCTLHSSLPGGSSAFRSSVNFEPPLASPTAIAPEHPDRNTMTKGYSSGEFKLISEKRLSVSCASKKYLFMRVAVAGGPVKVLIWASVQLFLLALCITLYVINKKLVCASRRLLFVGKSRVSAVTLSNYSNYCYNTCWFPFVYPRLVFNGNIQFSCPF